MTFQGALIREQGVEFAIVIVKGHVLQSRPEANRIAASFHPVFGGVPVVLMAQDFHGTPTYYGRSDIVRFMTTVPLAAVPWSEYQLN